MKKIIFGIVISAFFINYYIDEVKAAEPVVTIEIPASEVNSIDVKYEKPKTTTPSKTSKAMTATKDAADKTVSATKKATQKTVTATKDFTEKTVDGAKDVINNLNPNKPVTLEELENESQIRILKNERKGLKSAYNSRIKDLDAKIKAAEKSTTLSSTQKQNTVHSLNKEKINLINQRDKAIEKYDKRIEAVKAKK